MEKNVVVYYVSMTEGFIRHFIAVIGALICLLAFFAGYKAGQVGWWWMGGTVIMIYFIIYNFLEV